MVDLATLALKVDSSEVGTGVGKLDQLTAAGTRTEAAVDRLGDSSAAAGVQIKTATQAAADYAQRAQLMAAQAMGSGTAFRAMGASGQLAGHHVQNLAFQANDLFVGLASGQAPMTVFMQQGAQIGQIMGQAGVGVGGLGKALLTMAGIIKVTGDVALAAAAKEALAIETSLAATVQRTSATITASKADLALAAGLQRVAVTAEEVAIAENLAAAATGRMTAASAEAIAASNALAVAQGRAAAAAEASAATQVTSLTPWGRVATAVAATLAVLTTGFLAFKSSISDDAATTKLVQSLGLTKKELKELKDTGITAGDTFKGLWKTISDGLELGPVFAAIKEWASDAFAATLRWAKMAAAGTYAAFVGSFNAIGTVWKALPSVIGEAAIGAANLAIKGVEFLINRSIQAFNGLLLPLNALLGLAGLAAIRPFTEVALPRIENAFAGSTARMSGNIKGEFAAAYGDAISGMDAFGEAWERNTLAAREARLRGQAATIIGDRPEKNGAAAKAHKEKAKALTDEEKAYLAAMKAAQQYLAALENETAKIGKTAIEIKRMEVAAAAAAAPLDELKLKIINAGEAWVAATKGNDLANFIKNSIEPLEFETSLLGLNTVERARSTAERELEAAQIERGTEAWQRYMDATVGAAEIEFKIEGMEAALDMLNALASQSQVTGEIMRSAFGGVGDVFGSLLENIANYQAAEQDAAIAVAKGTKSQALADKELSVLRARNTGQTISGLKSLFKEHSAGYKVMSAIEKGYAILQAINTVRAIALDATKTASSVANSAVRASADGVAAVAKAIASLPFPLNIAAGVATAAALVSFGVKMFGGGGGGGGQAAPTSSDDLQAAAGTGSVLGDAAAKSESIANSLEIVASNSNRDLEYSNAMLRSLRSIDTSIAKLAGNIAKQIQVSGSLFDTSALKLGSSGSGGFLGQFASSTTRTLYDAGIDLAGGTVADIIANGINGQTYQIVQQVKKKSGFLGIGGGTRTTYQTTTGAIDAEITDAIGQVFASLRQGLIDGADVIGLQGAAAILDAFQVNIGRISFAGLTGQEIEDQLNAIFSKVGDDMAGALLPSLTSLQLVGEGLFETFIRVAREYQVVDVALRSIGKEFGAVGVSSIAARDSLVQLFGSLDDFVEQTAFFAENFLSDAERIAPVASAVREELARLGLSGIATRDQFKAAVLGLDLTTTAGREMYAALLAVAPAFDKVAKFAEAANKKLSDGFAATVKEFEGYAASLTKYRDSLRAGDLSRGNAYAASRAAFFSTAELAAQGQATSLAGLEGAGKTFLEASRSNASSLTAYLRDVASVANAVDRGIFAATETADYAQLQLDALTNAASILASIDTGIANVQTLLGGTPAVVAAPAIAPSTTTQTDTQAAETRAQLAENRALLMQVAENTSQLARLWARLDGDGMLVRTDEDTPIHVTAPTGIPVSVDQV